MCHGVIYLRTGYRRPIQRQILWPPVDVQGAIPAFWCSSCGAEVFAAGALLCYRCAAGEKGADFNENNANPQPLPDLYQRAESQRL